MRAADLFLIREFLWPLVLSILGTDLLQVVHSCPLAFVAGNGDRYSVGYPAAAGPLPVSDPGRSSGPAMPQGDQECLASAMSVAE
jgi:hypothetical protein